MGYLYDEYFRIYNKYISIYGENMIVLFQNGGFYEIYGVNNETEKIGKPQLMSELLGITLSRKDNSILQNDRQNLLQVGFPISQMDKYVSKLTDQFNYTVILFDQVETPTDKGVKHREVTNIISPAGNINYNSKPDNNYLIYVYIEYDTCNLVAIDISTGDIITYYTYNTIDDINKAVDDMIRFIEVYLPKELIITMNRCKKITKETIENLLGIYNLRIVGEFNKMIEKLSYQNDILLKVYKSYKFGLISPIEFIGLEKYPGIVVSLIMALDYLYKQNENNINNLKLPKTWIFDDVDNSSKSYIGSRLILENNALYQLNIISNNNKKQDSIFNLINNTSTSMGRRYLHDRLVLPYTNVDDINKSYINIERMIKNVNDYELLLSNIIDIERMHRKLSLGIINPSEFYALDCSYKNILEVYKLKNEILITGYDDLDMELNKFISEYKDIFDINKCGVYSNTSNICIFKKGINNELDTIENTLNEYNNYFIRFNNHLYKTINKSKKSNPEVISTYDMTYNDENGYYIALTATRYETYKKNVVKIDEDFKDIIVKDNSKILKISCKKLNEYSINAKTLKLRLYNLNISLFKEYCINLYNKYKLLLEKIVLYISIVDFYKSGAKTAIKNKYYKPEIKQSESSYIKCESIRHPIIENFQTQIPYISQSISMNDESRGILLFGVNCSGKSSLMKAIGINIIMAQAGLFVASEKFEYYPFKVIMTRIIGNDNLFKGQSSFAVEMSELRTIIKRANNNTLILGDEICHGTETISAISIVAASIISLSNKNACFLFATHLHHLSTIDEISNINNVKMFHLKVKYDDINDILIYDRKLEEGSGSNIYGLEVAKAMHFSTEFITLANNIRKNLRNILPLIPTKTSSYNKDLMISYCGMQGCDNNAIDTHHIKFQENADKNGFIDDIHKNHKSNLLPLCKNCHNLIHSGVYKLNGYILTTDGIKLDLIKEKVIGTDKETVIKEKKKIKLIKN